MKKEGKGLSIESCLKLLVADQKRLTRNSEARMSLWSCSAIVFLDRLVVNGEPTAEVEAVPEPSLIIPAGSSSGTVSFRLVIDSDGEAVLPEASVLMPVSLTGSSLGTSCFRLVVDNAGKALAELELVPLFLSLAMVSRIGGTVFTKLVLIVESDGDGDGEALAELKAVTDSLLLFSSAVGSRIGGSF